MKKLKIFLKWTKCCYLAARACHKRSKGFELTAIELFTITAVDFFMKVLTTSIFKRDLISAEVSLNSLIVNQEVLIKELSSVILAEEFLKTVRIYVKPIAEKFLDGKLSVEELVGAISRVFAMECVKEALVKAGASTSCLYTLQVQPASIYDYIQYSKDLQWVVSYITTSRSAISAYQNAKTISVLA